jgi:hypothetical protein
MEMKFPPATTWVLFQDAHVDRECIGINCLCYIIHDRYRIEVLRRLTDLDRQSYQEEFDQSLHIGATGPAKARGPRSRAASASDPTLDLDDIRPTIIEGGD